MRCSQCGMENDTDARFCKKCGIDLAGKTTQPNSSRQGRRGGFYRFCLAAATIWTSFLLGSFLAMGISMVSHGVTDQAAFGIAFGMGFVLFAGLWFIVIVVLLLLALATRPSPPVKWPGAAKVATASLAILALFWPIVSASRLAMRSAPVSSPSSPPSVAGNAGATAGQWQIKEDSSPMDGSKRIVISRDAENDIEGSLQSKRPSLIVRCQEGKTDAYIAAGMAASVEYDTDRHTVRLRFDDGKPTTQHWDASTDHEALFAPNAIQFARESASSKTLTFQFTPFDASPAVARFNLEGLAPYLQKAASACGWRVAEETKPEGSRHALGEAEADVTALGEGEANVDSWPQADYVRVDGGARIVRPTDGVTPLAISLTTGAHRLEIVKDGYKTEEVPVLIKAIIYLTRPLV